MMSGTAISEIKIAVSGERFGLSRGIRANAAIVPSTVAINVENIAMMKLLLTPPPNVGKDFPAPVEKIIDWVEG